MKSLGPSLLTTAAQRIDREFYALVETGKAARVTTGFGRLDREGKLPEQPRVELWISARMTHVFCLAAMLEVPGARELAEHGINALTQFQQDHEFGGFYSAISASSSSDGKGVPLAGGERKESYAHAFVILAAASGTCAQIPGARQLLDRALELTEKVWWEADAGRVCESFDREFGEGEAYRGVNANMHTVECLLAAYDATGEDTHLRRACGILDWVLKEQAASHDWFIPEHFDSNWRELPDYNRDQPAHPFRPWGYTIGHSFEWARLCLHARAALAARGEGTPQWMWDIPVHVFAQAVKYGWGSDGKDGFVYTIDPELRPVVRERMHWVVCEAIGVVAVMLRDLEDDPQLASGTLAEVGYCEAKLRALLEQWWEYCLEFLIVKPGLWWHELDADNQPSSLTWPDKPDIYHAAQACLLMRLKQTPCFAGALAGATS